MATFLSLRPTTPENSTYTFLSLSSIERNIIKLIGKLLCSTRQTSDLSENLLTSVTKSVSAHKVMAGTIERKLSDTGEVQTEQLTKVPP